MYSLLFTVIVLGVFFALLEMLPMAAPFKLLARALIVLIAMLAFLKSMSVLGLHL